ncbi:MAG: RIP metalloprotease RseP [Deltaproteobacteria bacterium RIFOXYA12_FULL_61_11]|nr:MAG: RIP metalloprotease RseP [Deltaproteobacteria bacterium RIFOXYA12_FULL_61_11]
MTIAYVVILFGVLVFVHELGHFLAAKLFKVRVEKFSLGFGPKLFSFTRGETTYLLSALPLGGYVRLLGESPVEPYDGPEAERAFSNQHVLKRIVIVLAGPVFNLILPLFLFSLVYLIGWPYIPAKVGEVLPGSPAAQAGLLEGDEILTADGETLRSWDDLTRTIKEGLGRPLDLGIRREGRDLSLRITPQQQEGLTEYGEFKQVGKIGILYVARAAFVGLSDPSSPAALAGLRSQDEILSLDGRAVLSWHTFTQALLAAAGRTVEVRVKGEGGEERTLNVEVPPEVTHPDQLGLYQLNEFLREIADNSAAQDAGLRPGDRLVAISGMPLSHWKTQALLDALDGTPVPVVVERAGQRFEHLLTPRRTEERNPFLGDEVRYRLGLAFYDRYGEVALASEQYFNPLTLIARSTEKTAEIVVMTLIGLGKLVTGEVSSKTVGGPILIYQITSKVRDLLEFFRLIALLSITLAVINLLPIPVLDGGHLLFFGIELVFRRPVNLRIWGVANQVGLTILVALIIFTFYNDLVRLFS